MRQTQIQLAPDKGGVEAAVNAFGGESKAAMATVCVPLPGESSGRARDDLSCQMPTFLWRKRAVNANGSSWSNHQQRAQHGATHDPHVDRTVQLSTYIHTCVHTHRSTVSVCLSVCATHIPL